jgi:hypothetical protein
MFTKLFGILVAVGGLLCWTAPARADTGNEWKAVCADCHEPGEMSEEKVSEVTQKILDISAGKLKHKKPYKLDAATAKAMAEILTSQP